MVFELKKNLARVLKINSNFFKKNTLLMSLNFYRELKLSRKKSILSHFKTEERTTVNSRPKGIQLVLERF